MKASSSFSALFSLTLTVHLHHQVVTPFSPSPTAKTAPFLGRRGGEDERQSLLEAQRRDNFESSGSYNAGGGFGQDYRQGQRLSKQQGDGTTRFVQQQDDRGYYENNNDRAYNSAPQQQEPASLLPKWHDKVSNLDRRKEEQERQQAGYYQDRGNQQQQQQQQQAYYGREGEYDNDDHQFDDNSDSRSYSSQPQSLLPKWSDRLRGAQQQYDRRDEREYGNGDPRQGPPPPPPPPPPFPQQIPFMPPKWSDGFRYDPQQQGPSNYDFDDDRRRFDRQPPGWDSQYPRRGDGPRNDAYGYQQQQRQRQEQDLKPFYERRPNERRSGIPLAMDRNDVKLADSPNSDSHTVFSGLSSGSSQQRTGQQPGGARDSPSGRNYGDYDSNQQHRNRFGTPDQPQPPPNRVDSPVSSMTWKQRPKEPNNGKADESYTKKFYGKAADEQDNYQPSRKSSQTQFYDNLQQQQTFPPPPPPPQQPPYLPPPTQQQQPYQGQQQGPPAFPNRFGVKSQIDKNSPTFRSNDTMKYYSSRGSSKQHDFKIRPEPQKQLVPYKGKQPADALPEIFIADVIPESGGLADPNLQSDVDPELLWVPQTDTVSFRPMCLCASQGYYVNLLRVKGSGMLSRHKHPGPVHGYVLKGSWKYLEHDWTATPGSYVFEPPGEVHTLVVPDGVDEMITMFHVSGSLLYCDENGKVVDAEDVFTKLDKAKEHYEKVGLGADYVKRFMR